ncbi:unnamed protein product, partial [Didymodactylos carnosus]
MFENVCCSFSVSMVSLCGIPCIGPLDMGNMDVTKERTDDESIDEFTRSWSQSEEDDSSQDSSISTTSRRRSTRCRRPNVKYCSRDFVLQAPTTIPSTGKQQQPPPPDTVVSTTLREIPFDNYPYTSNLLGISIRWPKWGIQDGMLGQSCYHVLNICALDCGVFLLYVMYQTPKSLKTADG